MPHIFISSHGGWSPKDGYVQVPRGMQVFFYTNFAKNLISGMAHKVLAGTYLETNREIGEYRSCPNMQWSALTAEQVAKDERSLNQTHWGTASAVFGPPAGMRGSLQDVFDGISASMGREDTCTIHWLACQNVKLKKVGGYDKGVNAADFSHDSAKPGRYRMRQAGGQYKWL